jgi:hypothetical protein
VLRIFYRIAQVLRTQVPLSERLEKFSTSARFAAHSRKLRPIHDDSEHYESIAASRRRKHCQLKGFRQSRRESAPPFPRTAHASCSPQTQEIPRLRRPIPGPWLLTAALNRARETGLGQRSTRVPGAHAAHAPG